MSYPFTHPSTKYGFRRRWGDPHVGIVGSGPGRPLRKYVVDAEVGLPQRGPGLGSLETPVSEGVFNVGPARGFTQGVFTADPPWATPRYIAEMKSGVAGLGAFGQTDACGVAEIKAIVAKQIKAAVPASGFSLKDPITGFTLYTIPISSTIQSLVNSGINALAPSVWSALDSAASSSISSVRTELTKKITPVLVSALKPVAGNYASVLGSLLDNALKGVYESIAKEIQKCKGIEGKQITFEEEVAKAMQAASAVTSQQQSTSSPYVLDPSSLMAAMAPKVIQDKSVTGGVRLAMDMSKIETWDQWETRCKAAGGVVVVQSDGSRPCVPSTSAAASSSSTLPLIIGAAAIAALLLTRI